MAEGKIVAKDLWRTEWAAFARAKEACDARGMAAFLLREHEHLLTTGGQNWKEAPLASMDVLLYACRAALAAGDAARALEYEAAYERISVACHRSLWLDAAKWAGVASYQLGDFAEAARQFERLGETGIEDAEYDVYRGNALFRLGRAQEAQTAYARAVRDARAGRAAAHNLALTLGPQLQTGDEAADAALAAHAWADGLLDPAPREIPEMALSETFELPIFINCRDRLTCLRQLVDWLLAAGYQNIYLIDNASTYPPLLAYYQDVIQDGRVRLLTLSRNFGHRALWRARILEYLDIRTPFVYTDPDVLPIEACPSGLVARLYQILRRYPFVDKVGTGIVIDDLPAHVAAYVQTGRQYRQVPLEEAVDFCPCDTTFALYAPGASYSIGMSIGTRGRLQVRHLPWYLDPAHLPDDEAYYVAHADASSTFAKDAKKDD